MLDCPKGNINDKRGYKLCLLQTPGNLFILELGLQSSLVTVSSKCDVNIRNRRLGHASMETLRKLGFYGELDDFHICPQGRLKQSNFSRKTYILCSTTSRASPLRCYGSFHRALLGRKTLSPFRP
jgi:hypothetical protein